MSEPTVPSEIERLLTVEEEAAFDLGQAILQQSKEPVLFQQRLNLLETILVSKFPHLGTEIFYVC